MSVESEICKFYEDRTGDEHIIHKITDDIYIAEKARCEREIELRVKPEYVPYVIGKTDPRMWNHYYFNYDEALLEAICMKYMESNTDISRVTMMAAIKKLIDMR